MCNHCYGTISNDVLAIERQDLRHEDDDDLDGLLYEDNTFDYLLNNKLDNE